MGLLKRQKTKLIRIFITLTSLFAPQRCDLILLRFNGDIPNDFIKV